MTDRENELQFLFKKNAELNSPKNQTTQAEPLEAKLRVPFTDTADFDHKLSEMEKSLQEIRDAQDAAWRAQQEFERIEQQARIDAEEKAERANRKQTIENRIWQTVIVILGVLTLAATIFGAVK